MKQKPVILLRHNYGWLLTRKKDICSDVFLRKLHKKMFGDVWIWAGEYRSTEKNIGIAPYQIPSKIMQLFDDVKFWIENKTYSNHEIAVRLHHKLVQIHPFPNGNGRLSRLMADLVLNELEGTKLYWGDANLATVSEIRLKYIESLRKADAGDYNDLLNFTRNEKI
ncbi:MAG: mobile mystery protein B [Treponema sp.]|nr:mobile mystery protein B [Treponema sp.]